MAAAAAPSDPLQAAATPTAVVVAPQVAPPADHSGSTAKASTGSMVPIVPGFAGPASLEPPIPTAVPSTARPDREATGTPLGVRVGFYAVLALLVALMTRRPRDAREPSESSLAAARVEPRLEPGGGDIVPVPRVRDRQPDKPIRTTFAFES